jgi:alkylhydroperoxidase family enzyme
VVDPRAVADRHPDETIRILTRLTVQVTERPWALSGVELRRASAAGLDDAAVLHAILQTSLFGHLNRIADAVGVDADYPDTFGAPQLVPSTPPYLVPTAAEVPDLAAPRPIELAIRDGAVDLLAAWTSHAMDRDEPLTRRQRSVIAAAVAVRLGDASVPPAEPATALDRALVELADVVTLAPWRLGPAAYEPVRGLGLVDDEAVFDAVATASTCTVSSRIAVALAALARP